MVKWTALDPCTCLSGSDSELYVNFEFCEKKDHSDFKKRNDLQNQVIYVDQIFFKNKSLHIVEDGASGDIELVIFKNIYLKNDLKNS